MNPENIDLKTLEESVGECPSFNPKEPAEPQIELWKAWSVRRRMLDNVIACRKAQLAKASRSSSTSTGPARSP